jgi:hypothetical protein
LRQVNRCPFVEIADTKGSKDERYNYVGNINGAIIENHVNESERATGTIDGKVARDLGGYAVKGYNNLLKDSNLSYYQYKQEKDSYNKNISNYEFFAQRLAQEDYRNDKDEPEGFNIEEYYGNESLVYFDILGNAPLRLLTSQNGYVIWDKDSGTATVSCDDIRYVFRVNSDRTISLIKNGFDYGKFKRTDAELVRYELKGKYLDNIFIKKDLFNKYFEISDTHEEAVNQNIAKTEDSELSQLAREYIERLDYLYGDLDENYVPKAQADLLRSLDKISKDKGLGGGITNTYSIKDAMRIILDEQIAEVWRQSLLQGVPKEMIASVLFREIMCYDVFDKYQDGSMGKTVGISQISPEGIRINDSIISTKENKRPKYRDLTDAQLNGLLKDDRQSVEFAALALKARSYMKDISVSPTDEEEIEKVFAEYNGYEGQIPVVTNFGKKLGMDIRMPEFGLVQYKETYGEETYEYCVEFKRYFSLITPYMIENKGW